jgi:exosortase H (IPTLxxWG-CTERM-specific)
MGYSKKKKDLRKKQPEKSLFTRIQLMWTMKLPVIFFVLGFIVLMVLFYVFWLSDFCQNQVEPHIVSVNARLSSFILRLFGMGTVARNETISSSACSVNIAKGCDAMEAMALYASALLAFPARWKFKLVGLGIGLAMLFALNILRVTSLFFTGVYFPKAFEFMHVEVWQILFILFAIGLWIFWIKWTRKGE